MRPTDLLCVLWVSTLGMGACRTVAKDTGGDQDGDGYASGVDCDDGDAGVHPGAEETWYDGVDGDCDGSSDYDADGDGFDASGYGGDDCLDTDAAVHPGADELCDGLDDDCDGEVDEQPLDGDTWYTDADGDGYGDPAASTAACQQPSGAVADGSDCDDGDAAIHPGADELCDGVDDDCDGDVDEDDAVDAPTWYRDGDGDGYGDPDLPIAACSAPQGRVESGGDCDDGDPTIHPDADETCDGVDNDCDGLVDEDDALDAPTWYPDADGDGYGDESAAMHACAQPSGTLADGSDCDDAAAAVNPAADELCDGLDNDCDGDVDEDDAVDAPTWYRDGDGDGYGNAATTSVACSQPSRYVADDSDCDDASSIIHPGADELCDGLDNDCDGSVDEDPVDGSTWYADTDGDGYGDPAAGGQACSQPSGAVADDSDCDDGDATVHPGADELCNRADDDCDGVLDEDAVDAPTWYLDADGDGYGVDSSALVSCTGTLGAVELGGDCDDGDAGVSPGAQETMNGVDDDCDALVDCEDGDLPDAECAEYACDDGLDDDGDGLVDCLDDDCWGPACHPAGVRAQVLGGTLRMGFEAYDHGLAEASFSSVARNSTRQARLYSVVGTLQVLPDGAASWTSSAARSTCTWSLSYAAVWDDSQSNSWLRGVGSDTHSGGSSAFSGAVDTRDGMQVASGCRLGASDTWFLPADLTLALSNPFALFQASPWSSNAWYAGSTAWRTTSTSSSQQTWTGSASSSTWTGSSWQVWTLGSLEASLSGAGDSYLALP